jgi:hypothetical protein
VVLGVVKFKMRNTEYLDKTRPEDTGIGELQRDADGTPFRMINGSKIIQIEEKTQKDKDMNLIINRMRSFGTGMKDYFNSVYP